jgi:O-antigen/teichoic acid export membrane protein
MQWADPLLRGAYSLMLNTVATAGLGLIFWVVAARIESSQDVGRDAALIVSMMTIASICQLNLNNTIPRFLPQAGPRASRWVLVAYAAATTVSAFGALGFVLLAPSLSRHLSFIRDDHALAVTFIAAVTLWSVFGLQDAVLTALRRTPWVPIENALFGLLKLALLPALVAVALGHAIFVAWILPMAALIGPVNWLIFGRFIPRYMRGHPQGRPVRQGLRGGRVKRFLVQDYLGSVFNQAVIALPPLLIVGLLGSRANAYFFIPFTLVISFDTLFVTATTSLVVEGAFADDQLAQLARRAAAQFARLLVPGVVVLIAAAPILLLPFGSSYVSRGTDALRILACATAFRVAIALVAAVWRLQGHGLRIFLVYGLSLALLLPLVYLLSGSMHIEGVALAWLVANAVTALVASPALVRLIRSPGPTVRLAPAEQQPQPEG